MSSIKKSEKKICKTNHSLETFAQKALQLEFAYDALQRQFLTLKDTLQGSLQTLEKIVMHMNDGLMFVSLDGQITLFNPAAAQILEADLEAILNGRYWDHFSDTLFGFSIKKALSTLNSHQRVFLTLNNAKEIEVSTSIVPEKGLLLMISLRVEKQKLLCGQNQTERLQELGEMAATLAHEIRNPLGGIQGFAELLKRDLEASSHQNMVRAILEGTHTINRLVSDVLDYAKPLNLHFETVDLVPLIHQVISRFPTCRFTCPFETHTLSLDQDHIRAVLFNLLRNASEAGATAIEIELSREQLSIKDNGEGISPQNLKKIFTPFFTTKTKGTGLGLAQCLAIIKGHGGLLEITSEQGIGTQIIIKL